MEIIVPGSEPSGVIERTITYVYDPLYWLTEANYDDGLSSFMRMMRWETG